MADEWRRAARPATGTCAHPPPRRTGRRLDLRSKGWSFPRTCG